MGAVLASVDVSKTIDNIDHNLLCWKLEDYGFDKTSLINWATESRVSQTWHYCLMCSSRNSSRTSTIFEVQSYADDTQIVHYLDTDTLVDFCKKYKYWHTKPLWIFS